MKRLLSQVIAATLGLWLASKFVAGVVIRAYPETNFFGLPITEQWQIFLLLGVILGSLNYFVKPILKTLALPLEIVTLGFLGLFINTGLIWLLDIIFDELSIPIIRPLAYTTLIIWGLSIIVDFFLVKNKS